MHVCLICNEYPPSPHGGIGSSNKDLAEGLVANGHHVTVAGIYSPPDVTSRTAQDDENLRIIRLRKSPSWLRYRLGMLSDRWRLRRFLQCEHRRRSIDLVECSDYGGWLPWRGIRGVPTVSRLQGTNYFFDTELKRAGNSFEHGLERKSLLRSDFWIGLSRYVYSKTLELCSQREHRGEIIHHAVDTSFFSPSESSDDVERGLIVFVNSVNQKKGVEQLIEAANKVFAHHPVAHLALIGQATGGENYRLQLESRINPEYRARVTFTGRIPRNDILPWLRRAHLCCYPSQMETFGLAPVEAMAVGKPVIYSNTGPGPEVLEDGVSGLLCNPFDSSDIAEKITRLLSDQTLAARLGAAARERVLKQFDKRDWIQRNIDFYNRCCASP